MEVVKIIVHKLDKKQYITRAKVHPREKTLEVSREIESFLEEIKKVYEGKKNKAHGIFQNDEAEYPFSKYLNKYLSLFSITANSASEVMVQSKSEIESGIESAFVDFTKKAMTRFESEIKSAALATGGYVFFTHYKNDGIEYLMLVMLNDKAGISIDADTLDIKDITHIDLTQLHVAALIDISTWKSNSSDKYISFAKGKSSKESISKYFQKFIGCDDYIDSRAETKILIRVAGEYCSEKGFDEEKTREFKRKLYGICDNKKGEVVSLEEISLELNPKEPHDFLEFSNNERYRLSGNFEPHMDTLRRLYRFYGKAKGGKLKISFDSDLLDDSIVYNKTNKTLLIKDIPEDLKMELDRN